MAAGRSMRFSKNPHESCFFPWGLPLYTWADQYSEQKNYLLFLAWWQGKEIVGSEGEIQTELVHEKQFSVPVHSNGKQN